MVEGAQEKFLLGKPPPPKKKKKKKKLAGLYIVIETTYTPRCYLCLFCFPTWEASFFYYGSCGSERARYIQGDGVEFPQDQSPEGHSFTRWGPKPYLQFSSEIWA